MIRYDVVHLENYIFFLWLLLFTFEWRKVTIEIVFTQITNRNWHLSTKGRSTTKIALNQQQLGNSMINCNWNTQNVMHVNGIQMRELKNSEKKNRISVRNSQRFAMYYFLINVIDSSMCACAQAKAELWPRLFFFCALYAIAYCHLWQLL